MLQHIPAALSLCLWLLTAAVLSGCGREKPIAAAPSPAPGRNAGTPEAAAAAPALKPADAAPAAAHPQQAGGRLVTVDIPLPKPQFSGTPKTLTSSIFKAFPWGDKPRPPFVAPEGTGNLALGRPVTASDNDPVIGKLAFVTDGDKSGEDGHFVELSFGSQYVQIDLGVPCAIHGIVVWHFHGAAGIYRDVVVQVADEPGFTANVRTVFNNDQDNSSGLGIGKDYEYLENHEGMLIEAKAVKGRYVRLYSNGGTFSDMNRYTEVEVYGKPAG